MKLSFVFVAAVIGSATCISYANQVVGGGFESPVVPGGSPYVLDVTPTGWSGTGDLAVQGYAGAVNSGEGNQWLDLNPGTSTGTGVWQSINLVGGTQYAFSFVYDGGGGGSTTQIAYSIGSLVAGTVSTANMNVYGGTPWATFSTVFTPAASGSVMLGFVPNGSWSGGFIDNVQVTPLGTPGVPDVGGSFLLLGCALGCLEGVRRKATAA